MSPIWNPIKLYNDWNRNAFINKILSGLSEPIIIMVEKGRQLET